MSFNDDPVQPDQGQGGESTSDAPYAEYLNRIPEGLREQVAPVFKEWDANTTRKFQEASEFRKQWEPYQQAGIDQLAPEQAEWAAQFVQALDDPQAIADWYQDFAQQNGLVSDEADDGTVDNGFVYDDPDIDSRLEQALNPIQQQLAEFQEWQQQLSQSASVHQRQEEIESTLSDLESKHPEEFNRDMIDKLVANHMDEEPEKAVRAAFADWQAIRNSIQKDTLSGKLGMPPAPEYGGGADGAPEEVTSMKRAGEIVRERLRQSREMG